MGAPAAVPRPGDAPAAGDAGRRPASWRGVRRTTRRMSPSAAPPAPNDVEAEKTPEKLLAPGRARTPTCAGACPGRPGEGRGMDSVTKGSGVAVSVLVAATASVLLLLPGHPRASSWHDVTSGGITTSSAAATSSSAIRTSGGPRPATATPAQDRRPAGSRPACRAAWAHGSRARPGPGHPPRLRRWTGLRYGPGLRHGGGGPGLARPGSCRAPRDGPHQEAPGRLPR